MHGVKELVSGCLSLKLEVLCNQSRDGINKPELYTNSQQQLRARMLNRGTERLAKG